MSMKKPHVYQLLAKDTARRLKVSRSLPLGGFSPAERPKPLRTAPRVLLFSPHPDDECIIGALPLRLLREGLRVINVAVTLGSRKDRRLGRWKELQACCSFIGYETVRLTSGGLEKITPKGRKEDPANWKKAVDLVVRRIRESRPDVIFFPHAADWNQTHIGTCLLVRDALARTDCAFRGSIVETEFWGAMSDPNLMVESTPEEVGDLAAALSFHVGEVQRNPYHTSMPAWMTDNVRRGGELVGGQGGTPPDFPFATLYRVSRWVGGRAVPAWEGGRILPSGEKADLLFTLRDPAVRRKPGLSA
jgi:LmbE family N-acetylglucosaminyl deacetylase